MMPMQDENDNRSQPLTIEKMALGALFLATFALSLIRVDMTDTPWHLATAREAFTTGHWPVRNTFSYTYPDYPLFQQYPIYQALLYLVFSYWRMGGTQHSPLLPCGWSSCPCGSAGVEAGELLRC